LGTASLVFAAKYDKFVSVILQIQDFLPFQRFF